MKNPSQTAMPTQTERTGGGYGQDSPQKRSGQTERTGKGPTGEEDRGQGSYGGASEKGIAPSNEEAQSHGHSAPNLQSHKDAGREPQKGGAGTYDHGTQTGGASQTGRSGGLDRNQDIEKENHEGEIRKPGRQNAGESKKTSEGERIQVGMNEPIESRNPGEPPSGADNTAPDED